MRFLLAPLIVFGLAAAPSAMAGGIQPENLQCEHLVTPLGIDATVPRLGWTLRATAAHQRGQVQTAYQILVASSEPILAATRGDLWDSGKVQSDRCAEIVYAGRPLPSYQWCYWKVRVWDKDGAASDWTEPAWWSMGILDPKEWRGKWLSYIKICPPSPEEGLSVSGKPWAQKGPSPLLRKTFEIPRPLARATASICGLGYYELRLNGNKVGQRVLDPKFTRYDKRALYATYDVTRQLLPGKNAVGVMLGNGFHNDHAREVPPAGQPSWRDEPTLLFQVRLDYADGTSETIATDSTWRASTGPVLHDGVRNGEQYDARREIPGWDTAAFDDSAWAKPQIVAGPQGVLHAQMTAPIRVMQTIAPVRLTEPKPGVFVFDMGQNFAGWAQLKVSGPAGTKITMRYGERVNADGSVNREAIEKFVKFGPFQTDTYVLNGQGNEVWEPRFAYHGFRWVEVTGFPGKPTLDNLRGRVVYTSFRPAGSWACSNGLLNKIQQMVLWSYRSNFVGIPTDCPQREKRGWTGDAHLAAEQAMYNFHNVAAYETWMNDFPDAQRADGKVPGVVPTEGYRQYDDQWSGPAWESAYVLIPWYLYQYCGDTRVLAEHYDHLKRYVDCLTRRSKDHLVAFGLPDWLPAKTHTPAVVTSTGYYYVDALILSKIARLLGKDADAHAYAELAEKIRQSWRKAFCQAGGVVANGSQAALSCALYQGLAMPEEKEAILQQLVANVQRQGGHLDVGILGAKYLFHALTDNGRVDVAYRIANQTTRPSYGYWLQLGLTTLCETWGGAASQNHVMCGDISAWFYQALAGINLDPERPAFKHIIIHPRPVGDLKWVKASHESIYGPIEVAWKRGDGSFSLELTVPVSTTATVYVPGNNASGVTEGGRPAAEAPGVKFLRVAEGSAVYEVGSGRYTFVSAPETVQPTK